MDENVAVQTPDGVRADAIRTGGRGETKLAPRVKLGEELPLFCEKCGYSLHGMPAVRCEHCTILQFHCPECGHHQPLNTLRPAAHRILGRLRAMALGLSVLFKLAFFGLLLFAWAAMPGEWIYQYSNTTQTITSNRMTFINGNLTLQGSSGTGVITIGVPGYAVRPIDLEAIIAHALFAIAFGVFARMLLLRWRRAWAIGLVLGALVVLAYAAGTWFTYWERTRAQSIPSPLNEHVILLALLSAATVMLGVIVAWPIWSGLVKLFLPKRTSTALLEWQQSLSDPSSLARQ